jgi:hypothetical protein
MKIVLRIFLLAAIAVLVYMCVKSIQAPIVFDDEKKIREKAISERLVEIRNIQIGYRNMHGTYAGSFADLQQFLNETRIPFITKDGELTDDQLKAGLTEREAVKKGLIRRDTTWVLAKDTLLINKRLDISALGKVPGFEGHTFYLDTATLRSPSGYVIPVFESGVLFDVYMSDLDRQLLVNLKDERTKLGRYPGLRVGSVTEINNNAGNWEF